MSLAQRPSACTRNTLGLGALHQSRPGRCSLHWHLRRDHSEMLGRPSRFSLLGHGGVLHQRSPPPDRLSEPHRRVVAITELTERNAFCATNLRLPGPAASSHGNLTCSRHNSDTPSRNSHAFLLERLPMRYLQNSPPRTHQRLPPRHPPWRPQTSPRSERSSRIRDSCAYEILSPIRSGERRASSRSAEPCGTPGSPAGTHRNQ